MKYVLSMLVVLCTTSTALAQEYEVTGVFCKNQEDLLGALGAGNMGIFLPDALAALPDCKIVLKHPVKTEAQFLGWMSAGIVKVRIYRGYTGTLVTDDGGVPVPGSVGEWFFTPTEASKIPMPQDTKKGLPT